MAKKRKLPIPTKSQVGDRVRVKQGIRDADYPDMPLGGWAGAILEVHDHGGMSPHQGFKCRSKNSQVASAAVLPESPLKPWP